MSLTTPRAARTAVAVCLALVAAPLSTGPAAAQAAPVELQIVGINDFHGHLDPGTGSAPSVAGVLGGAVAALRAANPNTLFVSAGDNIGASPFISSSQRDEPTIDVLNQMGLVASAVGNHEFDRGYADLAGRVSDRARFPILGANVVGESPELPEHEVVETGGVRVGFIGVVTQQTASLVSPSGIAGITFEDPVVAANRVADRLSDGDDSNGEADVLVCWPTRGRRPAPPGPVPQPGAAPSPAATTRSAPSSAGSAPTSTPSWAATPTSWSTATCRARRDAASGARGERVRPSHRPAAHHLGPRDAAGDCRERRGPSAVHQPGHLPVRPRGRADRQRRSSGRRRDRAGGHRLHHR
jgi:hypothetical protein